MAGGGGQTTNAFSASANGLQRAGQGAQGALSGATAAAAPGGVNTAQSVGTQGYMNPFQSQVIDNSIGAMDRARQMTMNGVGAQATDAGAFGGSRHGVADSLTNQAFMQQSGDMAAGLNSQGYSQAMGYAGADADRMNAGGAQARDQQMQAAGLMGNLSGQAFDTGRTINNDQMQQGTMQQAMMQALMDAGRGQFAGYTGAPGQSLQYPLAAIGGVPQPQTTTQTMQPGLFNYLSLGVSALPGSWTGGS